MRMSCFNDGCKWTEHMVMRLCAKCKKAMYCSRECQRIHWNKGHREVCGTLGTRCKYEVRDIGSGQHGLFATEKIYRSELIIEEKSILNSSFIHLSPNKDGKLCGLSGDVHSFREKYNSMSTDDRKTFESLYNNYPEIDPIYGIFITNAIPDCTGSRSVGIYPVISRCNHSCTPNAVFTHDDLTGMEKLLALHDIEAGAEICSSYLGNYISDVDHRKKYIKQHYGFDCQCEGCRTETVKRGKLLWNFAEALSKVEVLMTIDHGATYERYGVMAKFAARRLGDLQFKVICYDWFQICARINDPENALRWFRYCILIERMYMDDKSSYLTENMKYLKDITHHPTYMRLSSIGCSCSFYSCHSKKLDYYALDKNLPSQDSVQPSGSSATSSGPMSSVGLGINNHSP